MASKYQYYRSGDAQGVPPCQPPILNEVLVMAGYSVDSFYYNEYSVAINLLYEGAFCRSMSKGHGETVWNRNATGESESLQECMEKLILCHGVNG